MEESKKGGRIYEWDGFLSLFKDEKGRVATTMNAQKGRTALVVGATGLVYFFRHSFLLGDRNERRTGEQ
ncbi:hypothetical protein [Paenibacillus sp. MER TA 81-3]|uniref:hypothetical protein n=1 Tax=Paenibacillus sp. MER TA 81-3 TaxID=2939573 RepID=UPI00203DBCEE|nr:hypothetical protein [Paenibacillus sp. MER TA 81-3]